jgi:hypothetical protein
MFRELEELFPCPTVEILRNPDKMREKNLVSTNYKDWYDHLPERAFIHKEIFAKFTDNRDFMLSLDPNLIYIVKQLWNEIDQVTDKKNDPSKGKQFLHYWDELDKTAKKYYGRYFWKAYRFPGNGEIVSKANEIRDTHEKWEEIVRLYHPDTEKIIINLDVELSSDQKQQRIQKYGDFTRLNQLINSEDSKTTHRRMRKDPQIWEQYHRQYREVRETWTVVPYKEMIKRIEKLLLKLQIGDFGCGEAKIMEAIGANRVHSFDHVAINDKVTVCDMRKVPLPDDALDVAVFSLSLMGKNWREYIKEAKRCLATNGYLLIAETTKSLTGNERLSTLRNVLEEEGFEIYQDEERGEFTFIEAREL